MKVKSLIKYKRILLFFFLRNMKKLRWVWESDSFKSLKKLLKTFSWWSWTGAHVEFFLYFMISTLPYISISNWINVNCPASIYRHLVHWFKESFRYQINSPFWENIAWVHHYKLKKYEDRQEQCLRNGWITTIFSIEIGSRSFLTNATSA